MGVQQIVETMDVARRAGYRRDGYLVLPRVFGGDELAVLRDAFSALADPGDKVVHNFASRLIVTRNLWKSNPRVESLIWSLAPLAAQLMDVGQVRLIDDVALVKPSRPCGGNETNWHQDAPNFPFDRRGFLTIWIAVEDIPLEQGPLIFLPGSHRIGLLGAIDGAGEDVPVEALLSADDRERVGAPVTTALSAGDASVHDGATLHAAGANTTGRPRHAWGVRFVPAETLYTGGAHRSFDGLGLKPFHTLDHPDFPLISDIARSV